VESPKGRVPRQTLFLLMVVGTILAGCGPTEEPSGRRSPDVEDEPPRSATIPAISPWDAMQSPLCSDPHPSLVTDLKVYVPPPLVEPTARQPFRDPTYGTCLVRVTDRDADLAPEDESRGLKNEYSRVQSFNADGTYLLVYGTEGEWFLYDAGSLQPLGRLPLGAEPRWDAEDPAVIYYNDETRLMAFHVGTGETTLVHDFSGDVPGGGAVAVWMAYEGRPTRDARFWGLMAEDEEWVPVAFLVYDRLEDRVIVRDMRGVSGIEEDVDHVTISPLGTYFLASFDRACPEGELGDDADPCGLMSYDRDLRNGRGLLRIIGHYDAALDPQGREVIVYQDIDTDYISMLDLESGTICPLWPIDFSHTPIGFHFSGLAYDQPGWVLVSTHSGGYPDAYTWMDDQVFALELEAGGRVVRLAHTHSWVDEDQEHDYWAEPHATVNHDLTRILFTSNWGRSGTEAVEMYMVELPAGWMDTLP
jgi:hypothetical protein